ncbi:MAG: T9SS type A sorting domain-containing protein [Bacteroidales bacterium]
MKTKFILLYLVVQYTFLTGISQNSFEFIFQDTLATPCYSTFQDTEGYFISMGASSAFLPDYKVDGMILKFKDPENIIVRYYSKNDSSIILQFGFQMANGNYFVVGGFDDNLDWERKYWCCMQLDSELNPIFFNSYGIPSIYNEIFITDLCLSTDSSVIVYGVLDDADYGEIDHLYIAKISLDGEMMDTIVNTQHQADYFGEILEKPDNSGYYAIGTFGYVSLIELDSDLNITGLVPMNANYSYHGSIGARLLSNGNFIIGSLANQEVPGAFYDLHMWISDTDLVPIHDTVFFDEGKNWLPAFSGLDFIDENNIWVVTYPQMQSYPTAEGVGRIYLFDSQLNVKGAKYFGGDTARYLYSIKALEDGGCIITGVQDDEDSNGYTNAYFKKVMAIDIISYAEETADPNDRDVLVYPVPFENELRIETYRIGLSLSLFSLDGKRVISDSKLSIPHTRIETSHLTQGNYLYHISANGKSIQSGQIIKK